MAKEYNPWTGFLEDNATKVQDAAPVVGKKYNIRGKEFKVLEVKGDNVKVLSSNGMVNHLNIKMFDSKSTIDKAIRSCDAAITANTPEEMAKKLKAKGYEVESVDRNMRSKYIILYKNGRKFRAEVTRYFNGDLEIQEYNIHAV